jgi:hypothetical protein
MNKEFVDQVGNNKKVAAYSSILVYVRWDRKEMREKKRDLAKS